MPRLSILNDKEQEEFDSPPLLSVDKRAICFAMDDTIGKQIRRLHGPTNKVGFLLQYAYFKASRRLFMIKKFRLEDINYAARLLGISYNHVKIENYKGTVLVNHQIKILDIFSCKPFESQATWINKEISTRVERFIEPRELFFDLLHYLHNHNIEIPSYHALVDRITEHYINHESMLLEKLDLTITDEQKIALGSLLETSEKNTSAVLSQYRTINQSLQPKNIKASLSVFCKLSDIFHAVLPVKDALALTPQACEYYATWVKKAKLSQIKQITDQRKLYLYLIAFIQHQYFLRQDMFVDIFLRSVRSAKNAAARLLQETEKLTRGERKTAIKHLTKTRHNYRNLIDEITVITKSENLSDSDKIQQISKLLDEHQQLEDEKQKDKIAKLEKSLDDIVKDKNFFEALEKQSVKLQNRVSDIVKTLEFNPSYSDQTLISAIKYFKKINDQNASKAPDEFLTQDEKEAIINEQGKFKLSLYKILFFMHTADAIKSGQLNLKHSYRYLSIQDYLIEKEDWDAQRSDLLRLAGLEHFSEHIDVLAKLKAILGEKYHSVNRKIIGGLNPHISFNEEKNNRFHRCEPWKGRMARWRVVRGSRRFSAERSECKKIFMPA